MRDHLRAAFFMLVQSFVVTHQMIDCTHPSSDHHQGEQHLLAHLGLVLILEVVEIEVRPQMFLTSGWYLSPVAPVPTPCMSLQSIAQSIEKDLDPTSIHPLPRLLVVLTHQPVSKMFSLSSRLSFFLLPASASLLVLLGPFS